MTSESPSIAEAGEPLSAAAGESVSAAVVPISDKQGAHTASDSVPTVLAGLAMRLPLQLDLRVPLPSFRVQNLLSLEKGQVIESVWAHTEDLPLWSGDVHLVWTEFEVVDQKLAVRVTRLV